MTFEIDEELIFLGVIGEAPLERHAQQVVAQSHWLVREYALIHDGRIAPDDRPKLHPRQDIPLDVDAGRDLDQLQALCGELEHAAFGHVEHRLPALRRVAAGKRPVLDLTDEFRHVAIVDDAQTPVLDRQLRVGRP